jgi:hypothetical protein
MILQVASTNNSNSGSLVQFIGVLRFSNLSIARPRKNKIGISAKSGDMGNVNQLPEPAGDVPMGAGQLGGVASGSTVFKEQTVYNIQSRKSDDIVYHLCCPFIP